MSELTICSDYKISCPLCGRTKPQTTFCTEVHQADGSFNYMVDIREQINAHGLVA